MKVCNHLRSLLPFFFHSSILRPLMVKSNLDDVNFVWVSSLSLSFSESSKFDQSIFSFMFFEISSFLFSSTQSLLPSLHVSNKMNIIFDPNRYNGPHRGVDKNEITLIFLIQKVMSLFFVPLFSFLFSLAPFFHTIFKSVFIFFLVRSIGKADCFSVDWEG